MKSIKISDTSQQITVGSKADRFWLYNPYTPYYKLLRPKLDIPKDIQNFNNVEMVLKTFGIKDVGFGNWVTIEDRLNYINAMIIAFYDLDKVLKFSMNVGINKNLSVSFGARGVPGALAHYEPATKIINIARYARGTGNKIFRFLSSGGIHSFAHEYGHFLDYFAGQHLDAGNILSLNGGSVHFPGRVNKSGELRLIMDDIFEKIIWKVPGKKYSKYYTRLKKVVDGIPGFGEYYIRRNEIFARAFEVFISTELKKIHIKNYFLVKSKYTEDVYLTPYEMRPIAPLFKKLIAGIKARI